MMDSTTTREARTTSSGWRKSSRSEGANTCVELNYTGMVRDSKNPTGPALTADLAGLLTAVKSGSMDH